MGVPNLLNYPVEDNKRDDLFDFAHAQDHLLIIQKLQTLGVSLTFRQIYPFDDNDKDGIAERHQQMHDEFNAVLQLNGTDMQNIDDSTEDGKIEFGELNKYEHSAAHTALKI